MLNLISTGPSNEMRLSALKVLGSIGVSTERSVVKTVLDTLQDTDQDVRIAAIQTLGQLQAAEALAPLEAFVRQGGPELEAAVHAASQLGARGAS